MSNQCCNILLQESSLTIDDVTFRVFSKVRVQIKVETSSSRNRFVNISLVEPSVGILTKIIAILLNDVAANGHFVVDR